MILNAQILGDGPPLVILHGLFGSLSNWRSVAGELARGLRVLSLDLRNHGDSPRSAEMSYDAMAADVLDTLSAHDLPSAHILGHSMGGKAAMQVAVASPARVRSVIVVDTGLREYPPAHLPIFEALAAVDPARVRDRGEVGRLLEERLGDRGIARFLLTNLRRTDGGFAWRFDLAGLRANYARLLDAVTVPRPIDVPACLIVGGASRHVTAPDEAGVAAGFPRLRVVRIPGAGHWVHADAPGPFVETVRWFIGREEGP